GAHLGRDAVEPAHEHLERRRIEGHAALPASRSMTIAPPSPGRAVHRSGTHTVQSGVATTDGPTTGASIAGASPANRTERGDAALARTATTSIGSSGRA